MLILMSNLFINLIFLKTNTFKHKNFSYTMLIFYFTDVHLLFRNGVNTWYHGLIKSGELAWYI